MRFPVCALALLAATAQAQYVGSKACAPCHSEQYRSFVRSPMARSLQSTSAPEFNKPVRIFHSKTGRRYRISRARGQGIIEESFQDDAQRVIYSDARTVRYVIGSGNHARSFLIEKSGRIYQAPLTHFTRADRWDMSP